MRAQADLVLYIEKRERLIAQRTSTPASSIAEAVKVGKNRAHAGLRLHRGTGRDDRFLRDHERKGG